MARRIRTNEARRWAYGLWAVFGGLFALVVTFVGALIRYSDPGAAATAMAPVLGAIGTLTGAYFGIQTGSAGKDKADQAKNAAHSEALKFAAIAEPDRAAAVLGLPPSPPDDGSAASPAVARVTS